MPELVPLTAEGIESVLPRLQEIDSSTVGEPWKPEHYLYPAPGKWQCSFTLTGEAGEVQGFAIASLKDDAAHVHRIAVAPERRGAGLGGLLLAAVAQAGLKAGRATVTLKVNRQNEGAIRYYKRLGFEETGLTEVNHLLAMPAEALLQAIGNTGETLA